MDRTNLLARSWLRRAAIAAGITFAVIAATFWMRSDDRVLPTARIETPGGPIVVEIAATLASRSAGLSNREALDRIDGMLLKWNAPGRHPIWMKGMRFPLDLIWIGADGRILAILENVPVCAADPCSLYEPSGTERAVAVLELPAETASHRRLSIGGSLRIREFAPTR